MLTSNRIVNRPGLSGPRILRTKVGNHKRTFRATAMGSVLNNWPLLESEVISFCQVSTQLLWTVLRWKKAHRTTNSKSAWTAVAKRSRQQRNTIKEGPSG